MPLVMMMMVISMIMKRKTCCLIWRQDEDRCNPPNPRPQGGLAGWFSISSLLENLAILLGNAYFNTVLDGVKKHDRSINERGILREWLDLDNLKGLPEQRGEDSGKLEPSYRRNNARPSSLQLIVFKIIVIIHFITSSSWTLVSL